MTFIRHLRRLNIIDLLLVSYILTTFIYILFFYNKISGAGFHLVFRFGMVVFIFSLPFFDKYLKTSFLLFLRTAYPLILLGFFYSETDALNNVFFQNLDRYFARLDSAIFGFQPSLAFYNFFPQTWFSELMNLSYFSYYFLVAGYCILIFKQRPKDFVKTVFLITCSFLIYYLIFIMLPVSGPQYFFDPPHNQIADSGLFRKLVKLVEFIGERPTAAFPSSHVGIVFILILMAFSKNLKIWHLLIPVFILLSFSTVYIKAHYAVDIIGGIISAPLVLWISVFIYRQMERLGVNPGFINRSV